MTLNTFTSQQPRQCFNVSITNDTIVELNETFTARLTLASVTTISANRVIIDPPETTVLITDNDLRKLIVVSAMSQAHTLPPSPHTHTHTHAYTYTHTPVRVWMAEYET